MSLAFELLSLYLLNWDGVLVSIMQFKRHGEMSQGLIWALQTKLTVFDLLYNSFGNSWSGLPHAFNEAATLETIHPFVSWHPSSSANNANLINHFRRPPNVFGFKRDRNPQFDPAFKRGGRKPDFEYKTYKSLIRKRKGRIS